MILRPTTLRTSCRLSRTTYQNAFVELHFVDGLLPDKGNRGLALYGLRIGIGLRSILPPARPRGSQHLDARP